MIDVTKVIRERLAEIEGESAKLRKVLGALDDTPRAKQVRKPKPVRQRRPQGDQSDKLLGLIAETPMSGSGLAEQSGVPYPTTLRTLKRLEQAGRARRIGERQQTKWHAVPID